MKYLPFLNGRYSVAPGLQGLNKGVELQDRLVFQMDDQYPLYMKSKQACREEDLSKYYVEKGSDTETMRAANRFIVNQLLAEYPSHFELTKTPAHDFLLLNRLKQEVIEWKDDWISVSSPNYLSLFDALSSQVQEDLALCKLIDISDKMVALHICSPNHWDPARKAGSGFSAIHAVVPGMEKSMPHHFKMLSSVAAKGPFARFAWGLSTDRFLNHHPIPRDGHDPEIWRGRRIEEGCELYLRVERQTLNGLTGSDAFLFTIRTYFYEVASLTPMEKLALAEAIGSMSPQQLEYKGMAGKAGYLQQALRNSPPSVAL